MKKLLLPFICILIIVFTSATLTSCENKKTEYGGVEGYEEEEENDKYDGADQALAFEIERTKDLTTGKVDYRKLWSAIQQTEQLKNGANNVVAALNWAERGPNGDFTVGGNPRPTGQQTSGRIRAVMVDSLDATKKTVWAGGVDGGLWKNTDITASPSNWTLVNDFLANLAVSAICQDPRPGFQNNMYFCTGESFGNGDAVRGVGVFKSTDGGNTWNFLSSTSAYVNGTRIVCDNLGNVYLGTRGNGLLRSTDGGSTWTSITPSGIGTNICDLEISSTATAGRLHVATGIFSTSGYAYTDNPSTVTAATWTSATTPFTTFNQRTEMGISGNILYACPANGSYQVPTIWKSTDGGANWTSTATQPSTTWASGQGWYSLSVGINPANTNEVIVGGLDTWKTSNGGGSWSQLSSWATSTTGFYIHADQHNIQWWDGGNKLLFACDGGIHFSTNGGASNNDRNKGLRIKQFYSVAIHPTQTNYFLAGAQDNGMHRMNHPGLDSSIECVGGDGCYAAIDQTNGAIQFGSYVFNVYRRSTNNGASWSTPINNTASGRFVNPWDYDNVNKKIYACNSGGTFLRWNDPQTGSNNDIVSASSFGGANVSAVHVSPYTANKVYFGMGTSGGIMVVDNADVGTSLTGTVITPAGATGYVNCVVTGSSDQFLMATMSNYGINNVWVSTNGGTSWTQCDGNLPDMPVRWGLFHPDDNGKAFIATETGVWETDLLNGASTVWVPNTTFPNVSTHMIKYRASDRTIAAGTHGRGIWTATVPSVTCTPPSVTTQPTSTTVCAGANATFSIVATGSPTLTYQWQENNGSGWVAISGATNTSYTFAPTITQNGYQYRCVVTGACNPVATSNAATLTVNAPPTITAQPIPNTTCIGGNASFSITASGAGPLTYQWQVSSNNCTTWNNLSNAAPYSGINTPTLTISGATLALSGNAYRCVVNGLCSPAATSNSCITLTVAPPPSITQHPSNLTACAGNIASFSVTATGVGLTYQWQENNGSGWVNVGGVSTSPTYNFTANATQNGYQYRCIVSGVCLPDATSNPATLTVATALVITSQPSNSTVCENTATSFAVTITGTVLSYQWQVSTDGGTNYSNLTNVAPYSGVTTATLSISAATASMNNYRYRCVVTGNCPAINSNAGILTVNTAPSITTQPVTTRTICAGNTTTYSVTATGAALTYQWQESTNGGTTYNALSNIGVYSGVTTSTLTITGAPAIMNNNLYRCVIAGTCSPSATSTAGLLTVNTPVSITTQPTNVTVCETGNASFSVAASGTTPTYQWQVSTDGGATFNNITGANASTLNLSAVTASMNNNQYRCILNGAAPCGSLNSGVGILTVNTAPSIITQPTAIRTICAGSTTTYSVTATGTAITYQWQESTNGGTTYTALTNIGVYSGVTTSTLTITGAPATMNNNLYRCVLNGTCSPSATTTVGLLTVNTPVSITTQPTNKTICETGNVSFNIVAAGTAPTYQWQVSTNGGTTFNNITGANSNTLTLSNVVPIMNNNQYRCIVIGTAPCGNLTSVAGVLNVGARPTINLAAAPYTSLYPGLTTTITATTNLPAANTSYAWYLNNGLIPNTNSTYLATVNNLGSYKVVVTDIVNGCTNESAILVLKDSVTSKLFIYPSPNRGQFNVAYYNQGPYPTNQSIAIFDNLGRLVYSIKPGVSQGYQIHSVDLRKNGKGIYYVVLGDANGNRIKVGRVEVQ